MVKVWFPWGFEISALNLGQVSPIISWMKKEKCECVCVCVYVPVHVCARVHTYPRLCLFMWACIHMYIWVAGAYLSRYPYCCFISDLRYLTVNLIDHMEIPSLIQTYCEDSLHSHVILKQLKSTMKKK